jgi:hypothetical protein
VVPLLVLPAVILVPLVSDGRARLRRTNQLVLIRRDTLWVHLH